MQTARMHTIIPEPRRTAEESSPFSTQSVIGDGVLNAAKTEASLLALMSIEYEAEHEGESFKKMIAGTLRVTERHIGDMMHGKANATPRQLHTIATACNSRLFRRWLTIHFMGGTDGISQVRER